MKTKKLLSILLVIIMLLGLLPGCSGEKTESPVACCIIFGNHANQHSFTDNSFEDIEPLIRRAVYGGHISIILADGKPSNIEILEPDGTILQFKQDAMNSVVKARRIDEYTQQVMDFLRSDATKAVNPEVDLLEAIKEAERELHDIDIEQKYIVIMDTCTPTAGRINLTRFDLNTADITKYVKDLKAQEGILPDLTGIKIIIVGLGDVAEPQQMPDTTFPKVKKLFTELLVACGVAEEDLTFTVSASGTQPQLYYEGEGGYPYVSVVNFSPIEISDGLVLPDVGFQPNSAEMLDEAKATITLENYADAMIRFFNENDDAKLYLLGTTATMVKGGQGDIELSKQRANKLKKVLVELDVPADRLEVYGVGAKVPEHLRTNEFHDGEFDSSLAQANRKAIVYEKDNKDFHEILSFNGIDINNL